MEQESRTGGRGSWPGTGRRGAAPARNAAVLGVGGCGSKIVDSVIRGGAAGGVRCIAADADSGDLGKALAPVKVLLGPRAGGRGCRGDAEAGRKACSEAANELAGVIAGAGILVVVAATGGGTGGGGAPEAVRIARGLDVPPLVVTFAVTPFDWERPSRGGAAGPASPDAALEELARAGGAHVVARNAGLSGREPRGARLADAMGRANSAIGEAVMGVVDIFKRAPGMFADPSELESLLAGPGRLLVGCGKGAGDAAVRDAFRGALASPLMGGRAVRDCGWLLVNIETGTSLTEDLLDMINDARREAGPGFDIIFLRTTYDDLEASGTACVTLVASCLPVPEEGPA
ncbi:MAG: hypothetical protein LBT40_10920 [Deltaproteobacteria bacterium]|nr:hypothetical protein [Deltaproteobacteria bacterium]